MSAPYCFRCEAHHAKKDCPGKRELCDTCLEWGCENEGNCAFRSSDCKCRGKGHEKELCGEYHQRFLSNLAYTDAQYSPGLSMAQSQVSAAMFDPNSKSCPRCKSRGLGSHKHSLKDCPEPAVVCSGCQRPEDSHDPNCPNLECQPCKLLRPTSYECHRVGDCVVENYSNKEKRKFAEVEEQLAAPVQQLPAQQQRPIANLSPCRQQQQRQQDPNHVDNRRPFPGHDNAVRQRAWESPAGQAVQNAFINRGRPVSDVIWAGFLRMEQKIPH